MIRVAAPRTIYFLRREGGIGPIKIGCSFRTKHRVRELGWIVGAKLEILATAPGDFVSEGSLHSHFAASRAAGQIGREWYHPTPELLALIETVREAGELPANATTSRNHIIVGRRLAGETLQAIGTDYCLSRERVRQIVASALERQRFVNISARPKPLTAQLVSRALPQTSPGSLTPVRQT